MPNLSIVVSNQQSKTLLVAALIKTRDHLLKLNPPIDLLLDIQQVLDTVEYENDSDSYWSRWLALRGSTDVETFDDARLLFTAGFNFCQEEMSYVFEGADYEL